MKPIDKQKEFACELKEILVKSLPQYFKTNNYSSLDYKLSNMITKLSSNDVDESILRFISDYYQVNTILLDYNNEKYIAGNQYNDNINEKNLIIVKNDGIYLPLVNIFGEMPTKILYKCIINKLKVNKDTETKKTIITNKLSLKAISSYKLGDLQKLCESNNIPITHKVNGKTKNKTKTILYNELKTI